MMELATWAAIAILGPGAVVIFVWFLFDFRRTLREWRKR